MAAAYSLYGSFLSNHSYKAALMLALCGLAFDYRHVDLAKGEHKTPEFLRLNRYGQVPVLSHGNLVLCQSNAIIEYLSDQTGKFGGTGVEERQRIREWLFWANDRLEPWLNRTRFFERFAKNDPTVMDYCRKAAEAGLTVLDSLLAGKTWLVAERPTFADVGLFAVIVHMSEAKFDPAQWPNIKAWWDRVAALPGFKPPYDLLPKESRDAA